MLQPSYWMNPADPDEKRRRANRSPLPACVTGGSGESLLLLQAPQAKRDGARNASSFERTEALEGASKPWHALCFSHQFCRKWPALLFSAAQLLLFSHFFTDNTTTYPDVMSKCGSNWAIKALRPSVSVGSAQGGYLAVTLKECGKAHFKWSHQCVTATGVGW